MLLGLEESQKQAKDHLATPSARSIYSTPGPKLSDLWLYLSWKGTNSDFCA